MSAARISARRFSKPSPRSFENGRLFGSAQTRNSLRHAEPRSKATTSSDRLWKREDIDRASFGRVIGQILHSADEAKSGSFVRGIEPSRDNCARPSADTIRNRDVLFAVRSPKTDGLPDD